MQQKTGSPLRHRTSQPNGFPTISRNKTGISHQLGINRDLTFCGYTMLDKNYKGLNYCRSVR
jgi:hypothetical protein